MYMLFGFITARLEINYYYYILLYPCLLFNMLLFTVSHGLTVVRATQQVNGKWQFWGVRTS